MFNNISNFLEKFSKNLQTANSQKEKIIDIIKKEIRVEIPKENIEIKNYTLYIKASPAILNVVFVNKTKILDEIRNSVPTKIIDVKS